ncbi:MAG TPA: LptA/OstA family protein [Candidatus Aquilonibacter sp.]|nr:LptA/OstA family protein [Candidatus Aquilonibacter sp.]
MARGNEMRPSGLSVERLRWGLLAGALLLVGVLAVLLSYGRYRAVQAWKQIVKRSGATITHETNGIEWSQAVGGKTVFVLHASKALPHGEGRYTLENGTLVLYDAKGQPADRISGAEFEYDEKQGVAHAAGEVDMELELPKGLLPQRTSSPGAAGSTAQRVTPAGAAKNGGAAGEQTIHVRTSGLTYVKKLGVAATNEEVEISYGGMHGWSKGAEFDTGQSVVHLLADVRAETELHGAPVTLTAAKADLDRDTEMIDLTAPRIESRGRIATAGTAVLHLRKDGSLETVDAHGAVTLRQGTRTISAPQLHAAMGEESQVQRAELSGGVALVDTSAVRPMRGSAKTVRLVCDGRGNPLNLVAEGEARLSATEDGSGGLPLGRQMGADRMTLTLAKAAGGGTRVSAVDAEGNAWASGESTARGASAKPVGLKVAGAKVAGVKTTRVAADDLRLVLESDAAGKDEPQSLTGAGHTQIEQRMPDGTVETSGGDSLQATFVKGAAGGLQIASAVQTGNVQIKSVPGKQGEQPSDGGAERASLDGASDVLTLSGGSRMTRGDTSVSASTIQVTQTTGDAVAEGHVAATFVNANAKPGSPVTHVLAQRATLRRAAQTVEFTGTDAAPARMWQGASQVQAANLLLDGAKDAMQAWPQAGGVVTTVFASQGVAPAVGGGSARATGKGSAVKLRGERVVRVTSARLDYSGTLHEAVFTGGVVAQGEDGQVRAQRGVAFLTQAPEPGAKGSGSRTKGQPDPVAASLEKIVLSGAVKVEQPGRVGTGDQLLYTAATGEFVLTGTPGHPPHLEDDKQGSITGATLLFRSADSTIVVAGEPASHRVHTETTIRK